MYSLHVKNQRRRGDCFFLPWRNREVSKNSSCWCHHEPHFLVYVYLIPQLILVCVDHQPTWMVCVQTVPRNPMVYRWHFGYTRYHHFSKHQNHPRTLLLIYPRTYRNSSTGGYVFLYPIFYCKIPLYPHRIPIISPYIRVMPAISTRCLNGNVYVLLCHFF